MKSFSGVTKSTLYYYCQVDFIVIKERDEHLLSFRERLNHRLFRGYSLIAKARIPE